MEYKINIKKKAIYLGHKHPVYALAKINQKEFISAGSDGDIIHWSTGEKKENRLLAKSKYPIFCLFYYEDICFAGNQEGQIIITNLISGKSSMVDLDGGSIFSFAVINDRLYIGTFSGQLYYSPLNNLHTFESIKIGEKSIRAILYLEKHALIAFGLSDQSVQFWNYANMKEIQKKIVHKKSIFSLSIADNRLWAGSMDAKLSLWSLDNLELYEIIHAHIGAINSLSFNRSLGLIASASRDKSIKLWNGKDAELKKVINFKKIKGHERSVNKVLWLNDNSLISAGDDVQIIHWEIDKI